MPDSSHASRSRQEPVCALGHGSGQACESEIRRRNGSAHWHACTIEDTDVSIILSSNNNSTGGSAGGGDRERGPWGKGPWGNSGSTPGGHAGGRPGGTRGETPPPSSAGNEDNDEGDVPSRPIRASGREFNGTGGPGGPGGPRAGSEENGGRPDFGRPGSSRPRVVPGENRTGPSASGSNGSGGGGRRASGPERGGSSGSGGFGLGGGRGGGDGGPPDLDEIIERFQARFRRLFRSDGRGYRLYLLIGLGALALWLGSGFYRVEQGRLGVELIFGKYIGFPTQSGLNYNFPRPIGEVLIANVEVSRRVDVGYRVAAPARNGAQQGNIEVLEESLMLTGDQNIVDLDFTVFWKISDPEAFLFNIRDREATIKIAAESAMREVIGQTPFDRAVTDGRALIELKTLGVLQALLDSYQAGIEVEKVDMQKSDPPGDVIDAFNDVQRARQDRDRLQNEAEAYANSVIPEARGQAEQLLRESEGYRERLIQEADGRARRFLSVLSSYRGAPDVTRDRMYLEALGSIFKDSNKVIIDPEAGAGVLPHLPLTELGRVRSP